MRPSLLRLTDEFDLRHYVMRSLLALRRAHTSLSRLAAGMAYYFRSLPFNVKVDLRGFEPLTFSMPLRRAPNCATGPLWFPC